MDQEKKPGTLEHIVKRLSSKLVNLYKLCTCVVYIKESNLINIEILCSSF